MNKNKDVFFDIIIIGGGASGLFLASLLADYFKNKNIKIGIIEKDKILGRKILISGKGRCNFTNILKDKEELFKNYPRGKNFFKKIFYNFTNDHIIAWFNKNNIKTYIDEKGKCFPSSNNAKEILNLFLNKIESNKNIIVYKNSQITKIEYLKKEDNLSSENSNNKRNNNEKNNLKKFLVTINNNLIIYATCVVLASGGIAQYKPYIKNIDIKYTEYAPALYGFDIIDEYKILNSIKGISLKNIEVKIKGTKYFIKDDIIFTHKGVSGPAILHLSSIAAFFIKENNFKINLILNFLPDIDINKLKYNILKNKNKLLKNSSFLFNLPDRLFNILLHIFLKKEFISLYEKINILKVSIFNDDIFFEKFLIFFKNFNIITKDKSSIQAEFVTAGGIDLSQINPQGLYFKDYKELFAIGEILDIDGFTGGYNLQNAWSTAYTCFLELIKRYFTC
jgi:hypothetical protein